MKLEETHCINANLLEMFHDVTLVNYNKSATATQRGIQKQRDITETHILVSFAGADGRWRPRKN